MPPKRSADREIADAHDGPIDPRTFTERRRAEYEEDRQPGPNAPFLDPEPDAEAPANESVCERFVRQQRNLGIARFNERNPGLPGPPSYARATNHARSDPVLAITEDYTLTAVQATERIAALIERQNYLVKEENKAIARANTAVENKKRKRSARSCKPERSPAASHKRQRSPSPPISLARALGGTHEQRARLIARRA